MNLSDALKLVRVKPDGSTFAVAAGTSDCSGDIIDTADCEGVIIVTGLGTITTNAVTSVKVQQNSVNSTSGMADLEGSSITVADSDDDGIVVHDIYRPRERYLRAVIDRGTQNAVVDFQLAIKYGVKLQPISDDATVIAREVHASPAEGTA
jgi:hypothetical protein